MRDISSPTSGGRRLRRVISAAIVAASLGLSQAAMALGLGNIAVRSYLGQALDARIELISRTPAELESVTAALASAEGFRMVGIDRMAISVPLDFSVHSDQSGAHVRVTSQSPINDPVVQFVIEVNFANGRLLREYTLFLDPPSFRAPVPLPSIQPRQRSEPASSPATSATPAARTAEAPAPRTAAAETVEQTAEGPDRDTGSGATAAPRTAPGSREADTPAKVTDDLAGAGSADSGASGEAAIEPEPGRTVPDAARAEPAGRQPPAPGPLDRVLTEERAGEGGAEPVEDDLGGQTEDRPGPAEEGITEAVEEDRPKPVEHDLDEALEEDFPEPVEEDLAAEEDLAVEEDLAIEDDLVGPVQDGLPEQMEEDLPEPVQEEGSAASEDTVPASTEEPESAEVGQSMEEEQGRSAQVGEEEIPAPVEEQASAPGGEADADAMPRSEAQEAADTEQQARESQADSQPPAEEAGDEPEGQTGTEAPTEAVAEDSEAVLPDAPVEQAGSGDPESASPRAEPVSPPEPAAPRYQVRFEDYESYGPVQRGETLWGIASGLAEDNGYTINQAMLAIQRYNPDAFSRNNINLLKQGSILRLPPGAEMALISAREAMLEAMRQADDFEAIRAGRTPESRPPTIAATELTARPDATPETGTGPEPQGRLELVPPEPPVSESAFGTGGGVEGSGSGVGGADTEGLLSAEDAANAEAESAYLSERLKELEAELGQSQVGIPVSDTGLAEMEQRLRAERESGSTEAPLAVTPPQEEPAAYRGLGWWLLVGLVGLAGLVAWGLWRRGAASRDPGKIERALASGDTAEAVRSIAGEAEEILRVLDPPTGQGEAPPETDSGNSAAAPGEEGARADTKPEPAGGVAPGPEDPAAEETGSGAPTQADASPRHRPADEEEAVELDADDPETKLDLARAYISWGDTSAARELLHQVIDEGNEDQVAEARVMLGEI
jgi:pilus assembly protein FimV